jgi:hypothetical protein
MLDIQYIKDNLDNTSIPRQVLFIDNLQLNLPPRYTVASKLTYIDDSFKVQSVSNSTYSTFVIPIIDICLNSSSSIDVTEYFKATEEVMLTSLLKSITPKKISNMSLAQSIDFTKKEIYRADMKPKNVLVSKNVFNALLNKLYLLEYSKVFTIPTKHISYDNLNIFPINTNNESLVITLAEPFQVGMLSVRCKPYLTNNIANESIGMFIQNEKALSFSYIDNKDMNVILSSTGGNCNKCGMYDDYAPIDMNGKCVCYKCYKPF